MKKTKGVLSVVIGIASLSLNLSAIFLCKYIDELSREYWNSYLPYVEVFWLPLVLSLICIVIGIVNVFKPQDKKDSK